MIRSGVKALSPIMPDHCAVRQNTADGKPVGRCWHFVGDKNHCPHHGDVTGVQYRYRETGALTNDYELMSRRRSFGTCPMLGSEQWLKRFQRANPRAEVVAFRGRTVLVKIKPADADFARIYQVTGGTPEQPSIEEF